MVFANILSGDVCGETDPNGDDSVLVLTILRTQDCVHGKHGNHQVIIGAVRSGDDGVPRKPHPNVISGIQLSRTRSTDDEMRHFQINNLVMFGYACLSHFRLRLQTVICADNAYFSSDTIQT